MSFSREHYLSSHFEQSREQVTGYAKWTEHTYVRPALTRIQALYQANPIISVFVAVFAALSIFPVFLYLGLCLLSLVILLVFALSTVVFLFATITLTLGSILTLILLANIILSIFVICSLTGAYIAYKVTFACYKEGLSGARTQIIALYETFCSAFDAKKSNHSLSSSVHDVDEQKHSKASDNNSSPDSTVIIDSSDGPALDTPIFVAEDD
ncbi:hypothetical protein GYMLUDRAFT_36727 [Collybiopsis luxurians FD-317 M1]|nr:hypothetical protein GYMLUDRAFT_36727 [Collybiopsis luxurians FD-317 M1]